jgi:type II secretion system protein H
MAQTVMQILVIGSPLLRLRHNYMVRCLARHAAFTLLEMLAVLLVVGIMLSVLMVNWRTGAREELEQETSRLSLLLEQMRDESISTGEPLAVSFQEKSYQFWRMPKQENSQMGKLATTWQERQDAPFQMRVLAESVHIQGLSVQNQQMNMADENFKIVFVPSGRNPDLSLQLQAETWQRRIVSDALGRIRLEISTSSTEALP